ncbi:MAG TPA: flagellar protein FlaG [Rhodocyclaceae bacterium]|nr:flagellar protein FlaG [Rhodocyclaceae bacterium]
MSIQSIGGPSAAASPPGGITPSTRNEPTAMPPRPGIDASPSGATRSGQQTSPVSREQTEEAVRRIKEFVQPINDSIQFSLDEDTGFTVVKVVDLQTKEVLRQIPSEEAINIAKALDKLKGLLIQSKA